MRSLTILLVSLCTASKLVPCVDFQLSRAAWLPAQQPHAQAMPVILIMETVPYCAKSSCYYYHVTRLYFCSVYRTHRQDGRHTETGLMQHQWTKLTSNEGMPFPFQRICCTWCTAWEMQLMRSTNCVLVLPYSTVW